MAEQENNYYIEERPWGKFIILLDHNNHKVKKIIVNPGAKLSLQSHERRSENWIIVEGIATVINGEEEMILSKSEHIFISVGNKHRLENRHTTILEVIEIQTGEYFGEDDIIRYEDIYDRT